MRLQSGRMGELAAERFFLNNGWHMVRTQPAITILSMVTPQMVGMLKRFSPRLAAFGHMVIARLGKGGAPDYTGFEDVFLRKWDDDSRQWVKDNGGCLIPIYRACEVKESTGATMPASRLDKEQRSFMENLPAGCAWVGIFWKETGKFSMHPFTSKGSYKYGD